MSADWFGYLASVASGELPDLELTGEQTHYEYDDTGVTIYSDLDGDGVVDRVSRMDYSGQSRTVDLVDFNPDQGESVWNMWGNNSPERGPDAIGESKQSPGWTSGDWG